MQQQLNEDCRTRCFHLCSPNDFPAVVSINQTALCNTAITLRCTQSRTYSWEMFILSNIFVEICWNSLMAVAIFFCYYYPVDLYQNAQHTDQVHLRGAPYFLFLLNSCSGALHSPPRSLPACQPPRKGPTLPIFSSLWLWFSAVYWRLLKACPDFGFP